jgi:hypothetical protein
MTFGPKLVSQEIRLKSATKLILLVESLWLLISPI